MQRGGRLRRCRDAQPTFQMFFHRTGKTSSHVGAVQPDGRELSGQFLYLSGHAKGRRRQNETRPVFGSDAGNGKKDILRATADIQSKNGTYTYIYFEKFRCVHSFLFRRKAV